MGPNGDAKRGQHATSKSVIESLVSGSISSSFTTIVYQPLELLKTRIQIRDKSLAKSKDKPLKVLGRVSQSAIILIRNEGITYLWRGTGAVSTIHIYVNEFKRHKQLLTSNSDSLS